MKTKIEQGMYPGSKNVEKFNLKRNPDGYASGETDFSRSGLSTPAIQTTPNSETAKIALRSFRITMLNFNKLIVKNGEFSVDVSEFNVFLEFDAGMTVSNNNQNGPRRF